MVGQLSIQDVMFSFVKSVLCRGQGWSLTEKSNGNKTSYPTQSITIHGMAYRIFIQYSCLRKYHEIFHTCILCLPIDTHVHPSIRIHRIYTCNCTSFLKFRPVKRGLRKIWRCCGVVNYSNLSRYKPCHVQQPSNRYQSKQAPVQITVVFLGGHKSVITFPTCRVTYLK